MSQLTAKGYAEATGVRGKAQKAQRQADGNEIAVKARSRWLTALLFTVEEVQKKALARADGRQVPGMFELIAGDVARQLYIGSAAVRLMGFVGELAGDMVQGTIDLWNSRLIEQSTLGSNDWSETQNRFLMRAKDLRTAKTFINKARRFGIISAGQAERANHYRDSLQPLLQDMDMNDGFTVPADQFTARLLERATDQSITPEIELQIRAYIKVLNAQTNRDKAAGAAKGHIVKADPEKVALILAGEAIFDTAPAQ